MFQFHPPAWAYCARECLDRCTRACRPEASGYTIEDGQHSPTHAGSIDHPRGHLHAAGSHIGQGLPAAFLECGHPLSRPWSPIIRGDGVSGSFTRRACRVPRVGGHAWIRTASLAHHLRYCSDLHDARHLVAAPNLGTCCRCRRRTERHDASQLLRLHLEPGNPRSCA